MAEEQDQQPEPKESLIDGSVMNEVITMYLYGIYAFRRGRLTPPQAMEKVMQMARAMEKASALGKNVRAFFDQYSKKED